MYMILRIPMDPKLNRKRLTRYHGDCNGDQGPLWCAAVHNGTKFETYSQAQAVVDRSGLPRYDCYDYRILIEVPIDITVDYLSIL